MKKLKRAFDCGEGSFSPNNAFHFKRAISPYSAEVMWKQAFDEKFDLTGSCQESHIEVPLSGSVKPNLGGPKVRHRMAKPEKFEIAMVEGKQMLVATFATKIQGRNEWKYERNQCWWKDDANEKKSGDAAATGANENEMTLDASANGPDVNDASATGANENDMSANGLDDMALVVSANGLDMKKHDSDKIEVLSTDGGETPSNHSDQNEVISTDGGETPSRARPAQPTQFFSAMVFPTRRRPAGKTFGKKKSFRKKESKYETASVKDMPGFEIKEDIKKDLKKRKGSGVTHNHAVCTCDTWTCVETCCTCMCMDM